MEDFNCQKVWFGLKFCFFFYIDRNESKEGKGIDSGKYGIQKKKDKIILK